MAEEAGARWTWHRLSWIAPVTIGVIFLLVMVTLAGGFEPFLFIFGIIPLIAGLVGRRFPRRAGPITVLVIMFLLILINVETIIQDIAHPESFWNFAVFGIAALTLAIVGLIASITTLASRGDNPAPRVAYGAGAVIVVAVIVSGIATLTLEDDVSVAGDLRVVAEDAEFHPVAVSGSGGVGVFIENKDPIRHTFSIDALDLEVEIPGSTDRRVEISAPAGTYEFFCAVVGHDDMKGTITISG
jgi:plastocyanin